MQTGHVTTPFGRRPMTLALVKRQQAAGEIKAGKTADKWKVFRDASAAMDRLGLQSNSLAVLDALLSFYPESELRQGAQMIVFPSNIQLSLRAHGMAGATLRRHLAILVETGMINRKDSANGKRFARKDDQARSKALSVSIFRRFWRGPRNWPSWHSRWWPSVLPSARPRRT